MKTGKFLNNPYSTYHNKNNKNSYIPKFSEKHRKTGGNLCIQDEGSAQLQERSLMNNTYFSAVPYDILLDMKLNYTISKIF